MCDIIYITILIHKGKSMNVYEYAMKVEKDGEAYYRELASKSPNNGLKESLQCLLKRKSNTTMFLKT